ncbi:MAG: cytochrome C biogenesis protein, partial [bacterium]
MATGTWGDTRTAASATIDNPALGQMLWRVLKALGSLKITVAMFALGIIILFVGTLAQDEEQLKDVKEKYFNSWIAPVDLDVFLPITIWPDHTRLPFTIPIPGGATVGLVLLINLIAAKVTRFSMQATGGRFAAGL